MTAYKQPVEEIPLAVDFEDLFPAGQTLQVGSDVQVFDSEGNDVTASMFVSKTVGTLRIDSIIQGGEDGMTYKVNFTGKSQNYKFVEPYDLVVREL